jgi:ATP-dependent RNA helicase DDX10/DBP4
VDCPEDADTYIHRVGRTARHEQAGKSLLFLLPSEEEAMLQLLKVAKVPIDKINIKVSKKQSVQTQLQNACFKDPEIKYLGQKAFVSYMRSIHLQKHKSVFDVSKLPAEEFAHSLGLPGAPKIKFVKSNEAKNARRAAPTHVSDQEEESSSESEQDKPKTKVDRMFQRKNQNILSDHYTKLVQHDDDTGDFMHLKRADHDLEAIPDVPDPVLTTSAKKKLRKKVIQQYPKGEKLVFDDDGKAHPLYELETMDDYLKRGLPQDQISKHVEQESAKMRDVDVEDQQVAKLKRREKKLKRKMLEKQARQGTAPTAVLGGSDTDDDSEEEEVVVKPYKKPRTATLADEEALALSLLSRS